MHHIMLKVFYTTLKTAPLSVKISMYNPKTAHHFALFVEISTTLQFVQNCYSAGGASVDWYAALSDQVSDIRAGGWRTTSQVARGTSAFPPLT